MSDKVQAGDQVHIIISGVADVSGKGRTAKQVDHYAPLQAFLDEYGEGESGAEAPNLAELEGLAGVDAEAFKAKMASLTASMLAVGGKAMSQRVVDATCEYLVREKGFVISDKDPGSEAFYVSKADLMPTELQVPNDGTIWTVLAAAPYGSGA